jgi:eukaryotic-like serine/threonine-protein kinase
VVGQTISHYTILEKLGEGGRGVVYKAHDTKLDRTVALKFLPSHLTKSDEDKERFIREAKAAAALNHPNICTIHSVDEHDGTQFIVMEYIDGVTLREKIGSSPLDKGGPQGGLSIDTALSFALHIAEALAEAYDKGIVHRDIKPENIMVDAKNRIKVMDFGLAKLKGEINITKAGSTVGTVAYMSPEQIQGQDVDHRSDIFSFGVVLYEMLTGQTPFRGEHEAAMVYSIVNEDPSSITGYIPDASPELIHLADRLLEKDMQDRYRSIEDVVSELKRIRKESSGSMAARTASHIGDKPIDMKKSAEQESSVTISIPRFNNKYAIVFSLIIIMIFAVWMFRQILTPTDLTPAENPSIAVLPLENLSPDPDDAYFTDGVHDDIITQLSKIGDLKVIARNSVMNFPVGSRNYKQIGEELNVATVLEGSVRRADDIVRVSVQLIDVESMRTLWAETYDRHLTDIFTLQSEIAREITGSLRVSLTEEEEKQLEMPLTENAEAYDLYQRSMDYSIRRPDTKRGDFDIAIDFMEKAVEVDPQFIGAYAGLSFLHALYYWYGHDQSPQRLELSKRYADRAFELDPDSEWANLALANYYYRSRDYARALTYLEETRASVLYYGLSAWIQRRIGRWEQSIENQKREIELDPLNVGNYYELALSYLQLRQYDRAIEYLNKALSMAPDFDSAKQFVARTHILWKGDREPLRRYISHNPDAGVFNYFSYFLLRDYEGMLSNAERIREEVITGQAYVIPKQFYAGLAYTYLGDSTDARFQFEEARKILEEKLQDRPDDYRILATLSNVYAFLNMPEEAISTAKKVNEMIPLEKDALLGSDYIINTAVVYAILGNGEMAAEYLERALSIPSSISVQMLKIDPIWDPVREHESFRKLVAGEVT